MNRSQATIIPFEEWKNGFIAAIEKEPDTTAKGDRFVQRILHDFYGFSEDDAVNATSSAGAHDHGVDAIIISEPQDADTLIECRVIQGKYGTAADNLSVYKEVKKFLDALQRSLAGENISSPIDQCASVLRNQSGIVKYVLAVCDPLSDAQSSELDDIRTISHQRFGNQVLIDEVICLANIYNALPDARRTSVTVSMKVQGVQLVGNIFIGAVSVVDIYMMMVSYAKQSGGDINVIYDLNVRKWLRKRPHSVNDGIFKTLKDTPQKFVAFNNGITLICHQMTFQDGLIILEDPYIVNGCQTTRTLYEFMGSEFPGLAPRLANEPTAQLYRDSFLSVKVISGDDDDYRKEITRFSNKQNALRGRDFFALEDEFKKLKRDLALRGYFLQVQAGEFDALPKSKREAYRQNHVIDVFDAMRFYAAAILGKPTVAFGRSGEFTPNNDEFEKAAIGLISDDLLVPWLISQDGRELGYTLDSRRIVDPLQDDHRNQTRYFFLYILFMLAQKILFNKDKIEASERLKLYDALQKLRDNRIQSPQEERASHPLTQLLMKADQSVATYMALAKLNAWYIDRNAFLKNQNLLNPEHITLATQVQLLGNRILAKECFSIIEG